MAYLTKSKNILTIALIFFAVFAIFISKTGIVLAASWGDLRITEVLYDANNTAEWIELYNPTNNNITISQDWKYYDITTNSNGETLFQNNSCKNASSNCIYTNFSNVSIEPGGYILLINCTGANCTNLIVNGTDITNNCTAVFAGEFQLNNNGTTNRITDNESNIIDNLIIPKNATSKNYTYEKIFLDGWNDVSNWKQSAYMYGTPCGANSVSPTINTNTSLSCGINLEQNISTRNYWRAGETFLANAFFNTGGFWNPLNISFNVKLSALNQNNNTINLGFDNVSATENQTNETSLSFVIPNITNQSYNLTQTVSNLFYWRDNWNSCNMVYKNNQTSCDNCSCVLDLSFEVLKTLNASVKISTDKQIYSNLNDLICINEDNSYILNSEHSNTNLTGNISYYIVNSTNKTDYNAPSNNVNISPNTNETINETNCFNTTNLSSGQYKLCVEVYDSYNTTNITKEDTFGRQIRDCYNFLIGYNYTLSLTTNKSAMCDNNITTLSLTINLPNNSTNITNGVAYLICDDGTQNITANQTFNPTNGTTIQRNFSVITNTPNTQNTIFCVAFIQIEGVNITNNNDSLNISCAATEITLSKTSSQQTQPIKTLQSHVQTECSFINLTYYPKLSDGFYLVNVSNPMFNFSITASKYIKTYKFTSNCGAKVSLADENATSEGGLIISLLDSEQCTITATPTISYANSCVLYLKYQKPICEFNISLWNVSVVEQDNKTMRVVVTLHSNNCSGSAELNIKSATWGFSPNKTFVFLNANEEKNIIFDVTKFGKNNEQANISLIINNSTINSSLVSLINISQQNNTLSGMFLADDKKSDYSWLWFIFFVASAVFLGISYKVFKDKPILSGIYMRRILLLGAISFFLTSVGLCLVLYIGWFEKILLIIELIGGVMFMLYVFHKSKLSYESIKLREILSNFILRIIKLREILLNYLKNN